MTETSALSTDTAASMVTVEAAPLTPLARLLGAGTGMLHELRGAGTPALFSDEASELSALIAGVAVLMAEQESVCE